MSNKTIDKERFLADIQAAQKANEENPLPLPYMNPDLLDDFITWLYERVDLRSFEQSDIFYKLREFKKFLKSLPIDRLQLTLSQIYETNNLNEG